MKKRKKKCKEKLCEKLSNKLSKLNIEDLGLENCTDSSEKLRGSMSTLNIQKLSLNDSTKRTLSKKKFKKLTALLKACGKSQLSENEFWCSVKVSPEHDVWDRDAIIQCIFSQVHITLVPLGYRCHNSVHTFFLIVTDEVFSALGHLNNELELGEETAPIFFSKMLPPEIVMHRSQVEFVKAVVLSRYSAKEKILDLSSFHLNSLFLEMDIVAPLTSFLVMKEVLSFINSHMKYVKSINLSNNYLKIENIEELKALTNLQITVLNLQDNLISSLSFVDPICHFPLEKLYLAGNPLFRIINDYVMCIDVLCSKVKTLRVLDTVYLEEFLLFNRDNGEHESELSVQSACVSELDLKVFFDDYCKTFDAISRSLLLDLYVSDAVLEIKSSVPQITGGTFSGRDAIVNKLIDLPVTQHVFSTIKFSLLDSGPNSGSFEVNGKILVNVESVVNMTRKMKVMRTGSFDYCCSEDFLVLS